MAKKKTGRPRKVFDLDEIERLGMLQCTESEMASFCDCSQDTISDRMLRDEAFSVAYKRGYGKGKMSLRRIQWKSAQAGNITMQIWLGKQWLGQTDKNVQTHDGALSLSIEYVKPLTEKEKDNANTRK